MSFHWLKPSVLPFLRRSNDPPLYCRVEQRLSASFDLVSLTRHASPWLEGKIALSSCVALSCVAGRRTIATRLVAVIRNLCRRHCVFVAVVGSHTIRHQKERMDEDLEEAKLRPDSHLKHLRSWIVAMCKCIRCREVG